MASSDQYTQYAKVLDAFMGVLRELTSPAERRLLLIRASEAVETVKWWGLPAVLEKVFEDLRNEYGDALILSIICKFIVRRDKTQALKIAEEVLNNITKLSEWEYDRAMSLLYIAQGMYSVGEIELAKKYAYEAVKWARAVPDRSDRSISLSAIVPLLYKLGDKEQAVKIIDEIVYEPKKIDAILSLAELIGAEERDDLFRELVSKSPKDEVPLVLATYARALSPKNPKKVFELVKKALSAVGGQETLLAANVMLKAFEAFKKMNRKEFKSLANQLYERLESMLMQKLEDRAFLNVLFELLQTAAKDYRDRVLSTLSKLEDLASQKSPPENLYMLNRIALVYAALDDLEKSAAALELSLELSKDADRLVAIPSIIDAGAVAVKIMNEFPEDIPEDLVASYVELIKPMEYVEVLVRLSKENYEFIKRTYPGLSESDAINAVIVRSRTFESLQMEEKAKEIIQQLIDRDQYIIIHYILKYIYSIGIDEKERLAILNMLGRITELVMTGRKDKAKAYLDLIFSRLEKLNLPISPIVINYMHEYWLISSITELV